MRTLKRQLLLVNIATTGAAILAALVLMLVVEVRTGEETLVEEMVITSDVIGNQCTAALAFSEPNAAAEILNALKANAQIEYAAVYASDGDLFASHLRQGARAQVPSRSPAIGRWFGRDHLILTRPILLDGEQIGSISVRAGLDRLREVLLRSVMISAAALVLALLASGALLSRAQRSVTDPVTSLVRLMERVSKDKDYGRRADIQGPQELVSLADSFNDMLAAIQARDRELAGSLAELLKAYRKLEDIDRQKSDFISTVSHELRTPITSIKAFVELLLFKQNVPEERKTKLLATINAETDRLSRLIGDLLDLSLIETGVMHWRDQEINLQDVVRATVISINPLAQLKDIRIDEQIDSGLAPVHADRDRLAQVVMNVLSNAVKFTPAGGRVLVGVRRSADPAGIIVSVADSGPGIAPENQKRIFEKFQRSGNTSVDAVPGTGLGLAISRYIVEHYGGTIGVDSAPGRGSTFTFIIPHGRRSATSADAPRT